MKIIAALLLAVAPLSGAGPAAAAPCAGQIHPNPGFERGTTGWTAGPRIVVLGDSAHPAHTGRAYATLAGLDVTHTDLLRTSVTVPAGCTLTFAFWAKATTTETVRGDYLNVGLTGTGEPPKTIFALSGDLPPQWHQYDHTVRATAAERTVAVSFYASETAGNGVTSFDLDDVTFRLS